MSFTFDSYPSDIFFVIGLYIEEGSTWKAYITTSKRIYEATKRIHQEKRDRLMNTLMTLLKRYPERDWSWPCLSKNPSIHMYFLTENIEKIEWLQIFSNPNITEEFIAKHEEKMDHIILKNPSCPLRILEEYALKIIHAKHYYDQGMWYSGEREPNSSYRYSLSQNRKLTTEFIEKYIDAFDWGYLSEAPCADLDFIKKHLDDVDWYSLPNNPNITLEFIEEHLEKFYWYSLSKCPQITFEFIEKHEKFIYFDALSWNRGINEQIIEKYEKRLDWGYLSCHLPLELIEKYIEKINWGGLSTNTNLTTKFIEEHRFKLNWKFLSSNPCLTLEIVEKYKDQIVWGWLSMNSFKKK